MPVHSTMQLCSSSCCSVHPRVTGAGLLVAGSLLRVNQPILGGSCVNQAAHRAALPCVQGPIVAPPGEEGPLEPAYLRLFLLKYICPREACFGTMALQPGSQVRRHMA